MAVMWRAEMINPPVEVTFNAVFKAYQVDQQTIISIKGGVIALQPGEWIIEIDDYRHKFKLTDEEWKLVKPKILGTQVDFGEEKYREL